MLIAFIFGLFTNVSSLAMTFIFFLLGSKFGIYRICWFLVIFYMYNSKTKKYEASIRVQETAALKMIPILMIIS
jgi:hypothetical protein